MFCRNCGEPVPAGSGYCPSCGASTAIDMGQVRSVPETGLPAGAQLSSVGKRFGGFLLDVLLATATLVIGWVIWSLIIWSRGQSPAKQLLGMRVVHVERRHKPSWLRMAGREVLGKTLIALVASFTVIALALYFWPLWDDRKQELWDKMFDTIVVDDPEGRFA